MPVSRKRKRGHKAVRTSNGIIAPDLKQDPGELLAAFKIQMVNLAVVITAALVMHFIRPGGTEEFRLKVPLPLKIMYVFSLLLLSAKAGLVGAEYFHRKKIGDYRSITKIFRWDLALSVFIFGVLILVILFMFDVPSKLATYVGSKLSVVFSMLISVILGIISNLATDLLKRKFMRSNQPKTSKEKARTARR